MGLRHDAARRFDSVMSPDLELLTRLLGFALLLAGTTEYATLVRRRVEARVAAAYEELLAREGLRALVRVFAAELNATRPHRGSVTLRKG